MNSASSLTRTLAVRVAPVSRLISPKKLPGPRVATTAHSCDLSTSTALDLDDVEYYIHKIAE
jgi:hypothetical protein